MQQPTQNASPSTRQRRKTAIVGGSRLALEAFALLAEDPETDVVCL